MSEETAEVALPTEIKAVAPSGAGQNGGGYKFDASEIVIEIPWRSADNILAVTMRKPEVTDYLEHEKGVKRKSVMIGGEEIDESDANEANTELYDRLVLSATGKVKYSDKPPVKFDKETCGKFTFETKSKVIAAMSQSSFEVLADDDFAGLFEQDEPLVVRQSVGDPDSPQFVIDYSVAPMKKSQRQDYLTAIKVKKKSEKRRTVFNTEVNLIKKGMKLFAANLQGLKGGSIKAGAYSEALKEEYLKAIDPLVQMLVIDRAYGYYTGQARD